MLPWFELETTPPIVHAGARRFGFNRHDAARNVRGLIEGQLMAMANHTAAENKTPIEKVIATGGAQPTARFSSHGERVRRGRISARYEHSAALGAALRRLTPDRLSVARRCVKTVVSGFRIRNRDIGCRRIPVCCDVRELRKDYAMLERLHRHQRPIC